MIKVLLVDDHGLVREGLRRILDDAGDIEVVGEAAEGEAAVALACRLEPDVIAIDISMPKMDGLEATKQLRRLRPEIRIVVLTVHAEAHYARRLLRAGALGYVPKRVASSELLKAIRSVHRGRRYVTRELAEELEPVGGPDAEVSLAQLTDRELQVLKLIAAGRTNPELSDALGLSIKTIHTHRANILAKLRLRNNVDLARFAIESGLLQGE